MLDVPQTEKGIENQQEPLKIPSYLKTEKVTLQQAQERGIPWKEEPPKSEICRFCGKELQPIGFVIEDKVAVWKPTPPRCDCEQAMDYWREYDRRESENNHQKDMQEKISNLLGQSGIKKRFMERTFPNFCCDTPGRKENFKIAKEYADNFSDHKAMGDGLYIEGTNGTGKTHLAAAIALQLIGEGIPVICKTSSDLLQDIKKSFSFEGTKEHEVLDIYKKVDLLIIDDLGKEQCSDWSMSTLYSIMNDRYEAMKPTIITTNYNVDRLISALTPKGFDNMKIVAIISRLRETNKVMTMAWEDIRGSK